MWVGFILLLGLGLRLVNLDESLWFDEVDYTTCYSVDRYEANPSLHDLGQITLHNPSAPLYRLVMFAWRSAFGEREWVVRLPSLFCGLGGILLTYVLACRAYNRRTGLLAAFLLAMSPVHIWYSQEGTTYAMLSGILLLSVHVFCAMGKSSKGSRYAIYFVLLLAAVFIQYFALLFLFPLSLVALSRRGAVRWKVWGVHAGVFGAFVLIHVLKYFLGHVMTGMAFLRAFTPFEWWMLFFNWFSFGNSLWSFAHRADPVVVFRTPALVGAQVLVCLVLVRGMLARGESQEVLPRRCVVACLLLPPLALCLLSTFGMKHIYVERYMFAVLPFFATALAAGAVRWAKHRTVVLCTACVVLVAVASYGGFRLKNGQWTVYKANPDWRSASRFFSRQSTRDHDFCIVMVRATTALHHYLAKEDGALPAKVLDYRWTVPTSGALVKDLGRRGVGRVYLPISTAWVGRARKIRSHLDADPAFVLSKQKHTFEGIRILEYERRSRPGT